MRRKEADGASGRKEADGRVDEGGEVDKRTGGWANEFKGPDWRTLANGFSKGKTPKLNRQLTWPLEIQRGHPSVTEQLRYLPPSSQ